MEFNINIILGYLFYFSIVLLGFCCKKNKTITILMSLYMWAIIAFNTSSADYYSYEEMFLCAFEPRYSDHEVGYMALCKLFLEMGLSYTIFRCFIAFIIVFFTVKAIANYSSRQNVVLSLILIFPFLSSASGLRQACASAIVLFALKYLLEEKRFNVLKYLAFLSLAMLFHYSSVFYFIFIFAKNRRLNEKNTIIVCFLIAMIVLFVAELNVIYDFVSVLSNREKTLMWLTLKVNFSVLYLCALFLFCTLLYFMYQAKIIIRNNEQNNTFIHSIGSKEIAIISKCIIFSLLAFVGAILNSVVFLRLVLTLLPMSYAVCTNAFLDQYSSEESRRLANHEVLYFLIIMLCFLSTIFVYGYWIGGDFLKIPVGIFPL